MKLQLALDFLALPEAIKMAKKVQEYVDIIEAGTPLIKSYGLESVIILKEKFSSHKILADMKIADTGGMEVKMATLAGADIVTVLGATPLATIRQACQEIKNHPGCQLMVDFLGVENKLKKLDEIKNLNIDYLLIHTGIDEQKKGFDPAKDIKKIASATKFPLAVAGGIKPETVKVYLKIPKLEIIIVGGGITKAKNPLEAAQAIKKKLIQA